MPFAVTGEIGHISVAILAEGEFGTVEFKSVSLMCQVVGIADSEVQIIVIFSGENRHVSGSGDVDAASGPAFGSCHERGEIFGEAERVHSRAFTGLVGLFPYLEFRISDRCIIPFAYFAVHQRFHAFRDMDRYDFLGIRPVED